jgi:hypothetical protein
VLIFHLTVTLLTSHFLVDVPLVVEENVLGNVVNFFPWCGGPGIKIPVFLPYPWMLGNDIVMAVQTLFHRWNTRKIGVGHIGVAVLTLYLFDANVNVVAERYGLFRFHWIRRYSIE